MEKRRDAKKQKKLERRQQIDSQKLERQANAKANSSVAKKLRMEEGGDRSSGEDEAEVDSVAISNDDRLQKLFSDPKFAVDPTHPSFKKTSVINKLRKQKKQ